MTLRTRLALVGGIVLMVAVVGSTFFPRSAQSTQVDRIDQQLSASLPIAEGLASSANRSSPSATALSGVYVARVLSDGDREVVARPVSETSDEPRLLPLTAAGDTPQPRTVASVRGSDSWRAVFVTSPTSGELLVAAPFQAISSPLNKSFLLVGRIAFLMVVAVAGWWLLRLGLRPIAEVTHAAEAITAGDRSRRVKEGSPGTEAARLGHAFNVMLDEQHASEDRLRRFVADASHELRTPVAAIGGFADLYRHGGIDADQLTDVMRRIGQESARMRDLVEDMLLLAQLDEGRPLRSGVVDVTQLAADIGLDASASHPSRRVVLTTPPTAVVVGDDSRLRQVLSNLVANALIHTDGTVAISVTQGEGAVSIEVSDDGPGLEPGALVRAFDRFWRGDAARRRAGSGLGLPIVRSIVEAHGGTVRLTSSPAAGTRAIVTLPVDPPVHSGSIGSGQRQSALPKPPGNQQAT